MPAQYMYRNGAAPTAVNTETEITREVNLAAQVRPPANTMSKIRELLACTGWSIDTTSDQYEAIATLAGSGLTRAEFVIAGFGDVTTTIVNFGFVQPVRVKKVDVTPLAQGDVSFNFVQDGDTVATGFNCLGIKADMK